MPATDLAFDLPAYLRRIGLDAPPQPTLAGVGALVFAHATHIPFENLDAFLGRGVDLALAAVAHKLVDQRRGGWCFEQNLLLGTALRMLGVTATDLAARVLWGRPSGVRAPRTHRLLLLDLEGRQYVADVGFGVLTLTGVLALEADTPQPTPHEALRLLREGREWRLEALLGESWAPLYRFAIDPWLAEDFEAANYQLSRDPASMFVKSLALARALPGCRLTLRDLDFTRRARGEAAQTRRMRDVSELIDVIEQDFDIACRSLPGLAERCAGLFAPRD